MRLLVRVHHGSTHSPFHHVRSRLVPCAPHSGYDREGNRLSSSIHSMINWRAGLQADRAPVAMRPGDRDRGVRTPLAR